MRHLTLAFVLLLAVPAHAAKPPPLDEAAPAIPHGKPPPLGAPEEARPWASSGERATKSGSGFIVRDGRILTNNHVVDGCGRMTARNAAGRRVAVRVETTDPRRDLALLEAPLGFGPALSFRGEPPVARGETVVTYGFPLSGLLSSGPTLTTGNINALSGIRDNPLQFQISAPVQPGNSGGPLLDSQARVVGVVVSKLNAARVAQLTGGDIPQNVNFAVKGSEAAAFMSEHGEAPIVAATPARELNAAEVGVLADPSTVYLQCYR